MANLITLARLVLLGIVVCVAYYAPLPVQLANVPLTILLFLTDALDGWVARRLGQTTTLGALLDISVDRIVEYTFWIVLADLDQVPAWVAILFVVRGTLVDTLRNDKAMREGVAPFHVLGGRVARFLVAGRFMRTLYAVVKAHVFCWFLLMRPLRYLFPDHVREAAFALEVVGAVLLYACVALCLVRGVPVLAESLAERWHELKLRSTGRSGP